MAQGPCRTLLERRAQREPFGWHDTDGSAGPEFTITRGNNVWAQEDANGTMARATARTEGRPRLRLPHRPDPGTPTRQDAAINLFYWNNIIHDVWYQYGFDEPSGNFQENNYGNGGVEVTTCSLMHRTAAGPTMPTSATPPDGSDPRMQMFLWNTASPAIDGDLTMASSPMSTRMACRIGSWVALQHQLSVQCRTDGEGWSDFFSLVMTMAPGTRARTPRDRNVRIKPNRSRAQSIRPAPYSTDFRVNNFTYANTNGGVSQPHGIGSCGAPCCGR